MSLPVVAAEQANPCPRHGAGVQVLAKVGAIASSRRRRLERGIGTVEPALPRMS